MQRISYPTARFWSFVLLTLLFATSAKAQFIRNIAGGPHDGKTALEADIGPTSIAVGPDGTIYFDTFITRSIKKVDPVSGIVSVVAGNGNLGLHPNNTPALEGPLHAQTIKFGPGGKIYLSESGAVRVINEEGNIVSIAGVHNEHGFSGDGGLATDARFSSPVDFTFDNDGNLYIADWNNYRIRKVTASTQIVTTIAGTGSDVSSGNGGLAINAGIVPSYIALDGNGNLFFTDRTTYTIRKIDLSTGIITKAAGNGSMGLSGDGALAVNATLGNLGVITVRNNHLYILDSGNARIRTINLGTGIINTIAGTTMGFGGDGGPAISAKLGYPQFMTFDNAGDLLIADNGRIRKVSGGIINTIVGSGPFTGDGGPAVDAATNFPAAIVRTPNGDLYFTDSQNSRIRKINGATRVITTIAGTGEQTRSGDGGPAVDAAIWEPRGLALDADNNLLVLDLQGGYLRKIDLTTGIITAVAGNGYSGNFGENVPATTADISVAAVIATDDDGNIYISEMTRHRVRKIDHLTGKINTIAGTGVAGFSGDNGPAINAQLSQPWSVLVGGDGSVYIADVINKDVRVINPDGVIHSLPKPVLIHDEEGNLSVSIEWVPTTLAWDVNGDLLIGSSHTLCRYNLSTAKITRVSGDGRTRGTSNGIGRPKTAAHMVISGLAVAPDSDIFIADFEGNSIREIYRLPQTITFLPIPESTILDSPLKSLASASSNLPVAYTSTDPSIAEIQNQTDVVIKNSGTVTIIANQAGSNDYKPAPPVEQLLTVVKAPQAITFPEITDKTLGTGGFMLPATTTSPLAISYSVSDANKLTIAGTTATLVKAGKVTVTASQAGNGLYHPAPDVEQTFCINPAQPEITVSVDGESVVLTSSNTEGNQWYMNEATIPGATGKTYTQTSQGSYYVQTTVDGCQSEESLAATITGLESENEAVVVYPIPTRDELFVNTISPRATIRLTDILGRSLESRAVSAGTHLFDVRAFPEGVYLVRIQGGGVVTKTFLKTE